VHFIPTRMHISSRHPRGNLPSHPSSRVRPIAVVSCRSDSRTRSHATQLLCTGARPDPRPASVNGDGSGRVGSDALFPAALMRQHRPLNLLSTRAVYDVN